MHLQVRLGPTHAGAKANILPFELYKYAAVCDGEAREFSLLFYAKNIIDLRVLGEHTCDLLNLIKKVDTIDESRALTLDSNTPNFAELFTGRGLYQEKYYITLKDDAKPVAQQP